MQTSLVRFKMWKGRRGGGAKRERERKQETGRQGRQGEECFFRTNGEGIGTVRYQFEYLTLSIISSTSFTLERQSLLVFLVFSRPV